MQIAKFKTIDKETLMHLLDECSTMEIADFFNITRQTISSKKQSLGITQKAREKAKCIWDVFDAENEAIRRFDEKLRNAKTA